jgi:folate-dependent phosphoribosylglycinamide formyltransferase PurN
MRVADERVGMNTARHSEGGRPELVEGSQLRVMIVTTGNFFARRIIRGLLSTLKPGAVGVLEISGDYSGRTGIHSLLWVASKTTIPYLLYKLAVIGATKVGDWTTRIRSGAGVAYGQEDRASTICVTDAKAMKFISEFKPDILVSISCPQRIPASILGLARICAVNVHSSLLPRYAGLAPYYWVLANCEAETGTTVHYMTAKFDGGRILSQRVITIEKGQSAFSLFSRLADEGGLALAEGITAAVRGHKGAGQTPSARSYWSHPDWASYLRLRGNGFRLVRWRELFGIIWNQRDEK